MGDPYLVKFIVGQWNDAVAVSRNPGFFESESDHCNPFACCERVLDRVTMLRAADDDYQFVDPFEYVVYSLKVS